MCVWCTSVDSGSGVTAMSLCDSSDTDGLGFYIDVQADSTGDDFGMAGRAQPNPQPVGGLFHSYDAGTMVSGTRPLTSCAAACDL